MTIKISNTFAYYGYAELIFNKNGIVKVDNTNLQYDNIMQVFTHLTGGQGTRYKRIDEWAVIIANIAWYNQAPKEVLDSMFGTYRGNPTLDDWAEFHEAPVVTLNTTI